MKQDLENSYFVESLRKRLSLKGLTGVELSRVETEGGRLCTEQHLSRVLNCKQAAGKRFRSKFAKWLGLSIHEMINEGHQLILAKQLISNDLPKLGRRSTDRPLPEMSLDELSTTLTLYAGEVHRKQIELAAEFKKRIEQESKVTKELYIYRQIIDQSPTAMKIIRFPDKVIVYRNEADVKLEGRDLQGYICEEGESINGSIYDRVVTSRNMISEIIESESGVVNSVLSWPVYDTGGQLISVAVATRDITNRYHEAGVARTAVNRYEAVLSRAARFVYIYDERKRMVYTNATRPGGLLEHASQLDLLTFSSVALYMKKMSKIEEWQIAVDVIQRAFDEKKKGAYQARLVGKLLSSKVYPIIDGEDFRGVAILSHIVDAE